MHPAYRFSIRPITSGSDPGFELAVGMPEEKDEELVPINRTAFARRLAVQKFHRTEADVQAELQSVLDWLDSRPRC